MQDRIAALEAERAEIRKKLSEAKDGAEVVDLAAAKASKAGS